MGSLHNICNYLSMTIVLLFTPRQGNLGCKVKMFTYAEPYRCSARKCSHFYFLGAVCSMSALVPNQGEQVSIRVVQFWDRLDRSSFRNVFSSTPQTTFYCFHSSANSASEDQHQVLLTYQYCWVSFEGYQHLTPKSSTDVSWNCPGPRSGMIKVSNTKKIFSPDTRMNLTGSYLNNVFITICGSLVFKKNKIKSPTPTNVWIKVWRNAVK